MQLTASQQHAIQQFQCFLQGDAECFILKGYAGTGKTFLLKRFTEMLAQWQIDFQLVAPTGRATKILKERTQVDARTVHSLIYEMDMDQSTIKAVEEQDVEQNKYELVFNLKTNGSRINTVYIVDESSMVSDKHSEHETLKFGSGQLLTDFLSYVNIRTTRRKIVFVGDHAQLPPVNSNESVCFNKDYLEESFGLNVMVAELTDVFRQGADSSVLRAATALRKQLDEESYNYFPVQVDAQDLIEYSVDEAVHHYTRNYTWQKSIFITETNQRAFEHTKHIREQLGFRELSIGERLLVIKNTVINGERLFNGDFVRVDQVAAEPEIRKIPMRTKQGAEVVELKYRDVTISYRTEDGQVRKQVPCKIFENHLWSSSIDISYEERRAMIIDFQMRYPHTRQGTDGFKNLISNDLYFNALHVRFGYVITCHKAQGGEWNDVFVDLKYSQSITNRQFFRRSYTAITRARERIYFVNLPKQVKVEDDRFAIIRDMIGPLLAHVNAQIIEEQESAYQNLYYIRHGIEQCKIIVHYNKKEKITKVRFVKGNSASEAVVTPIFQNLCGRSLYDAEPLLV